jgi:hypothetical protein
MGRTDDAIAGLRAFRAAHPERAEEADLRVAQARAWGGDVDGALEALLPWVESGSRQAALDEVTYRSWRGDLDGALTRLEPLLAAKPDDRDARLLSARVRAWRSDLAGARAEYGRVLALAPGDDEARLGVAQLDAWSGRPGRARAAAAPLADAGGAVGRDARALLDGIAAGHGTWGAARYLQTTTSDGLESRLTLALARAPVRDGHVDVEAGLMEVALGDGDVRSALAGLSAAHPLGERASLDGGAGWRAEHGAGADFTWRVGGSARPARGLTLRFDAARVLLDATPTAIELGNHLHDLDASAGFATDGGRTSFTAGGGWAWISAGSTRAALRVTGEHRRTIRALALRAGFLARAFGYSETLPLGFFNPERYRYGGLTGGATFRRGRLVELDAALQGGFQRVNDDDTQFAWGYALGVAVAPSRWPVQLTAGWAQSFAGLPVTVPEDPSEYRESTFRFGLRVHDPRARTFF